MQRMSSRNDEPASQLEHTLYELCPEQEVPTPFTVEAVRMPTDTTGPPVTVVHSACATDTISPSSQYYHIVYT